MEGSVLSFLKAEWKVSDTGSAHWASSIDLVTVSTIIVIVLCFLIKMCYIFPSFFQAILLLIIFSLFYSSYSVTDYCFPLFSGYSVTDYFFPLFFRLFCYWLYFPSLFRLFCYWLFFPSFFQAILLLIILVMRKRIGLVVALFYEAGELLSSVPLLLVQPLWTFLLLIAFFFYWVLILAHLATSGSFYFF